MSTVIEFSDRINHATATGLPLKIRGSGSKDWYGEQVSGDLLDTRGYAGIIDYDPTELVISARCGTPLAEIEAALAAQQQMLAFEPPAFGPGATLGGVVASGLAGPRRANAGSVRDFVLGTVLLNGRGERLTFGGQVMKNVAGYDVSRLLTGSMGTLGLLLELSVKVLPRPQSEISLAFELGEAEALATMNSWTSRPLPVSATSWHDQRLIVRLSGSQAATDSGRQQLGGEQLTETDAQALWHGLREQSLPWFENQSILWRLSLPATTGALDLGGEQWIEWGGAQRWLSNTTLSADALRQKIHALGGHATLFKGQDREVGVFQPLPAPLLTIQRRLKASFDPAGIFNPGRLYPEL